MVYYDYARKADLSKGYPELYIVKSTSQSVLQCDYCYWGHLNKVDQLHHRTLQLKLIEPISALTKASKDTKFSQQAKSEDSLPSIFFFFFQLMGN